MPVERHDYQRVGNLSLANEVRTGGRVTPAADPICETTLRLRVCSITWT